VSRPLATPSRPLATPRGVHAPRARLREEDACSPPRLRGGPRSDIVRAYLVPPDGLAWGWSVDESWVHGAAEGPARVNLLAGVICPAGH